MASLQIRDLPEEIYRVLASRAQRERRSLAQQAIVELERLVEPAGAARRHAAIASLRAAAAAAASPTMTRIDPVEAVREDRDR